MAKIEDCPGFETFGSDVKATKEALNISRRALAEQVSIDSRYLANIKLEQTVPSVPVVLQLIRICKLPVERYFNPSLIAENTEQRQRVNHKLQLCPENICESSRQPLTEQSNWTNRGHFTIDVERLLFFCVFFCSFAGIFKCP